MATETKAHAAVAVILDAVQVAVKFCPGCQQNLPQSEFGPRKQSPDGLRPRCRACRRRDCRIAYQADLTLSRAKGALHQRKQYAADPAKACAYQKAWRQSKKLPKPVLSAEEIAAKEVDRLFRKREARKKTYRKNKAKVLAVSKLYRATHRAQQKAAAQAWHKANPLAGVRQNQARRARKAAASGCYTVQDIAWLIKQQRNRCAHSWCRVDLTGKRHVDHIIPLARGGSNERRNLQVLCAPCNLRKSAKHPIDFAQENGLLL